MRKISASPPAFSVRLEKPSFVEVRSASVPTNFQRDELSLNQLRFSSLGLYGRDAETSLIRSAYDRIRDASSPVEMVLISGRSGTGKTAAVEKIREDLRRKRCRRIFQSGTGGGFFARGKFDLKRSTKPYSGFVLAFAELCEDILRLEREGDAVRFNQMRQSLQEGVGSESTMLAEVVPGLDQVLAMESGSTVDTGDTVEARYDASRARNRFNFVVRRFVRSICSPSQPLVLFIDDLQWSDEASLELLQTIVTDRELSGLLFIGCFRDNEVDEDHPLAALIDKIGRQDDPKIPVTQITVGSLDLGAVTDMIADLLSLDKSKVQGLASIVHRRTQGNAFFVKQFLALLRDEGILFYCIGSLCWRWDEDRILSETNVADNVVDLLREKLQKKLDLRTREVLQMGACLGSVFEESLIVLISGNVHRRRSSTATGTDKDMDSRGKLPNSGDVNRLIRCLHLCVDEGLLDSDFDSDHSDTDTKYRFVHDQIQTAAFSLIPEMERDLFQLQVGEAIIRKLPKDDLEDALFIAVDLCNRGVDFLPPTGSQRVLLSKLNLRAGKKAMQSSAFKPAAAYLNVGISLLGPKRWEVHGELTLDLFSTLAEAEYCNGHFVEMNEAIEEVLNGNQGPFDDKLRAYAVLIHSLGSQDKMLKAVDTSLYVLDAMGVHFPRQGLKLAVVSGLISTKRLLKRWPIDSLTDLPVMEDEAKVKAMHVINKLCTYAYAVMPDLLPLLIFKMVQWSVRYGVSQYSPVAFAMYAMLLCGVLGDSKGGNEFGEVAFRLTKRLKAKETEARTISIIHFFVYHWVNPMQLSVTPSLQGYQIGMATGDVESAMLCASFYSNAIIFSGRPLSVLEEDLRAFCQQMKEYEQELMRRVTLVQWQITLNLMGHSDDPRVLTGEAMDQDVMLKLATDLNDGNYAFGVKAKQMWMAYYFGDYDLVWKLVEETKDLAKNCIGQYTVWRKGLFEGLTAFALARQTRRKSYRRHATCVMKKVKKWCNTGNANCTFILCLLEAEKAAFKKEEEKARKTYDNAIIMAGRQGLIPDKALANEQAGEFFVRMKNRFLASHYLGQAVLLYSEWGAAAKVDQLRKKHPSVLQKTDTTSSTQPQHATGRSLSQVSLKC